MTGERRTTRRRRGVVVGGMAASEGAGRSSSGQVWSSGRRGLPSSESVSEGGRGEGEARGGATGVEYFQVPSA